MCLQPISYTGFCSDHFLCLVGRTASQKRLAPWPRDERNSLLKPELTSLTKQRASWISETWFPDRSGPSMHPGLRALSRTSCRRPCHRHAFISIALILTDFTPGPIARAQRRPAVMAHSEEDVDTGASKCAVVLTLRFSDAETHQQMTLDGRVLPLHHRNYKAEINWTHTAH